MSQDNNIERLPISNLPVEHRGGQLSTHVRHLPHDEDVIDTGRLLRVIRRYQKVIYALSLAFGLVALLYSFLLRPMYTATSIARVNQNTSIVSVGNDVSGAIGAMGGGGRNFRAGATAIRLLQGGGIGQEVVTGLNMQNDDEFTGELTQRSIVPNIGGLLRSVKSLFSSSSGATAGSSDYLGRAASVYQNNVSVEEIDKTDLIRITYTSFKPQTAAKVANSVVDTFNRVESESQQVLAKSAQDVLNLELENVQQKLQLSERKLTEFSRKTGIVDLEDSNNIMSSQSQAISTSLIEVQSKRRDLEVLIANSQSVKDRSALPAILGNERIASLESELASLRSEYQEISAVFKDDYPQLKALSNRMSGLRKEIDREVNRAIGILIAEYQILKDKEENLQTDLATNSSDMLDLKDRSVALNILKREWESNKNLYQGLLEKVKRAGLAANLEMNRLSLLEQAVVPRGKSFPNIPKNVVMAMAIGGLFGLGIAFVMALRDRQFRSVREIEEHTGLPVLAVIPMFETEDAADTSRQEIALLSHTHPNGAHAETFRSLRTSLKYSMPDDEMDSFMISSSGPAEGKTSTIINLATTIAGNDKRVLIIDLDLRKPSLHKVFNLPRAPGVTDSLVNSAAHVNSTKVENLFVLTAGASTPNPTEILESDRCRALIRTLKQDFDVVLFDSPPVMGLADALVMSQHARVLTLAVDISKTNKDELKSTINRLNRVNAAIKGIIVTRHSLSQTDDYGYDNAYYYYNTYGGYHYGDEEHKRLSATTSADAKKAVY